MILAEPVFKTFGAELVITSITDGTHKPNSFHYIGKAFDARTRDVAIGRRADLRNALATALGPEFDVVLETDHIHIEHDPK